MFWLLIFPLLALLCRNSIPLAAKCTVVTRGTAGVVTMISAGFSSMGAENRAVPIALTGLPGSYTVERWRHDWPGCRWEDGIQEGNVSLVERNGGNWLQVTYRVGEIGPEQGGCGWRFPIGTHSSAELRYTVSFSKGFDWVKGGKLPGLCGGPENVSGGRPANGTNGFSARLMWRADGRGEAYVYHKNQPGNYGDRFAFPTDFRFPTETPVRVRMTVAMNDPGKRNGKLAVWIGLGDETSPERLVVSRADLEWRTVNAFAVDSLYFETFHGGSDQSWAPTKKCWAEFGEIQLEVPD